MAVVDLAEVKAHLNIVKNDNDFELLEMADAASNIVQYEVTASAWAAFPPELRLAVLVVTRRLWETQRGNSRGMVGVDGGEPPPTLALPLLPPLAQTLIEPHRRRRQQRIGTLRIAPGLA